MSIIITSCHYKHQLYYYFNNHTGGGITTVDMHIFANKRHYVSTITFANQNHYVSTFSTIFDSYIPLICLMIPFIPRI